MSGKYALIIGNTEYIDPGLAQLTAPGKDAEDFARVLKDQEIGSFDDVKILLNQLSSTVNESIDEFFDQKKPDDLLLLYFSGHGVRDELGGLYLAVRNTIRSRLRSTAIKSDYIREVMDQSRSRRQVLILDCCNSGAYGQGTKAATGVSIGTATAFEAGYGRIILTASDSTQFAWEGDKVIGETDNSLFTHYLVEGLEGEADLDGDGNITVDELYDYAYEKVKLATPKQTPSKFSSKQQGEIVLRQNMRIEDIKPISLPEELIEATEDSRTFVREGAVHQLEKLLKGKNLGLVRSAREALERIEREDDSRSVSQAATQVLEPIRQAEKAEEERKTKEEAERLAAQKAEEERLALQKAEAERLFAEQKVEEERKAKNEAKRLAALKAKEERLAREKAEAEQKAKQEAERLLAEQKAEEEQKAREEAERLALEKAEQELKAREKAEADRKAKEKAQKLARVKAEREATERSAREAAEKPAKEKKISRTSETVEPAKKSTQTEQETVPSTIPRTLGIIVIALILCGFATIIYLPRLFGGPAATEAPVATEPPATEPPATEAPTTQSPATEAPATEALATISSDLSSEWPMENHDPARTGYNLDEHNLFPPLKMLWSQSLRDYYIDGITVTGGKVALSGNGGWGTDSSTNQVYVLDASTGSILWDFTLPGGGVGEMGTAPAFGGNNVYFGGQSDENLYAVNIETGEVSWQRSGFDSIYYSDIAPVGNKLYVPDNVNGVVAFEMNTGEPLWGNAVGAWGLPTAVRNGIIFGVIPDYSGSVASGTLVALNDTDGTQLWQYPNLHAYFTWIVADANQIYIKISDTKVASLNISDGTLLWETELDITELNNVAAALMDNRLYVPIRKDQQGNGSVVALDSSTGETLWTFSSGSEQVSDVAAANGVVYATGWQSSTVYALSPADGSVIWSYPLSDCGGGKLAVAESMLFVSSCGQIYAFTNEN